MPSGRLLVWGLSLAWGWRWGNPGGSRIQTVGCSEVMQMDVSDLGAGRGVRSSPKRRYLHKKDQKELAWGQPACLMTWPGPGRLVQHCVGHLTRWPLGLPTEASLLVVVEECLVVETPGTTR